MLKYIIFIISIIIIIITNNLCRLYAWIGTQIDSGTN